MVYTFVCINAYFRAALTAPSTPAVGRAVLSTKHKKPTPATIFLVGRTQEGKIYRSQFGKGDHTRNITLPVYPMPSIHEATVLAYRACTTAGITVLC